MAETMAACRVFTGLNTVFSFMLIFQNADVKYKRESLHSQSALKSKGHVFICPGKSVVGQIAGLPGGIVQAVCPVEKLDERQITELCSGQQSGILHIYGNTALVFPGFYLWRCLPVYGICCPDLTADIGVSAFFKAAL